MIDGRPRPRHAAPKRRLVARARVFVEELEPWFAPLRQDTQTHGLDNDAIHQRFTRFLAERQRREANSRSAIEQRLDVLRHEFQDAMREHAMSFNRISQEFRGRGTRHEQLRQLVHTTVMSRMADFQTRFVRQQE